MTTSLFKNSNFRVFTPRPQATYRLFCFPHAGGSASYFQRWAVQLPQDVELYALQLPQREERIDDAAVDHIGQLLPMLLDELTALGDKPCLLLGHSMGATLAWELALALENQGSAASHLFLSGQTPPDAMRLTQFHRQPDQRLIDEIIRLDATPMALFDEPALRELILATLRHDYRLIETWSPVSRGRLRAPITVLHGTEDSEVTEQEARGWEKHTTGDFRCVRYPGGHFYLNQQWRGVMQQICETLRLRQAVTYPEMP